MEICKGTHFDWSDIEKLKSRGTLTDCLGGKDPLFIIPDFFLHFPNKLCYGYLRFELEMGKFLCKGREKILPRADLFPYLSKEIPFPSNLRQPQLSSFGKCKEKPGIPFWGWTPFLFPSKTCCYEFIYSERAPQIYQNLKHLGSFVKFMRPFQNI